MKKFILGGISVVLVLVCTILIAMKVLVSTGYITVNKDAFAKPEESPQVEAVIESTPVPTAEPTPEPTPAPTPEPTPAEPTPLPPEAERTVDLVMFMGQSNMAGNGGLAAEAPAVAEGVGYEFRAISDPTRLYHLEEPFGEYENNMAGVHDIKSERQGTLVSSFVNAYYADAKVPIVGVSVSQGNTGTEFWTNKYVAEDYVERYKRAYVWLTSNDYIIRYQYIVWLQGETDGNNFVKADDYIQKMNDFIRPLFVEGIQKCFIIRIGRTFEHANYYDEIQAAQTKMCSTSDYYGLASTMLSKFDNTYMIDTWHYNQDALNQTGADAGKNVAFYSNNRYDADIFDYKTGQMYSPENQKQE